MTDPGRWGIPRRLTRADLVVAAVLLAAGLLLVPLLATAQTRWLAVAGGALVTTGIAVRPVWAVVAYCALDPLIAGMGRGQLVPYLRPNEALLVPLLAGLALAALLGTRDKPSWRVSRDLHALDVVVLAVAFTGSVTTLLWMYARGRPITSDDLQYAVILWKLAAIFLMTRLVLRTPETVRQALTALVGSACVLAPIGILQALGVGPVIRILSALTPVDDSAGYALTAHRAMGTLGNPIAFGDVMLYTATIAAAAALRFPRHRRVLGLTAGGLGLAALASGQISIVLGFFAAALTFALVTGASKKAALRGLGLMAAALAVLQPVVAARLSSKDASTGLPVSWTGRYGRLENLETYFWPPIGHSFNWLLGVQTAARAPGKEWWRPWVYIESGYTWVLWSGGIVMLAAVIALVVVGVRTGRRLVRVPDATSSATGITLTTVMCTLAVLMIFDPHLTLRGGAEVLFVLLAIGANMDVAARRRATQSPPDHREAELPPAPVGVPA